MAASRVLRVLYFCAIMAVGCAAQKISPAVNAASTEPVTARPRVFQPPQPAQIVTSAERPAVQLNAANFRIASGEEIEGMELTLEKYESAFENLSLPQVREVWPTLDRQHERAFKNVFAGFKETAWTRHLGLECSIPKVTGEAANVDCRETLVYANAKGKSKEVGPAQIAVLLRRRSNAWVIEDMRGE
jgi:hypothetical protein